MNKILFVLCVALLFFLPELSFAAGCSSNGATIVYVNGIETTQQEADDDATLLSKKFTQYGGLPDTQIITGYNPTHLEGLGDTLESVSQTFGAPISNYDLDTILDQIAAEITTRKVLLLGHSQGTFYTNEMYDYLIKNGVPASSIAVYNVATPADVVAGNGAYLTSGSDKAINLVRVLDAEAGAPEPLAANILIPPQPGDAADPFGGHYFAEDYLAGAASRIVSDIDTSLAKLVASGTENSACFEPPSPGLSYDAQEATFALADPAAQGIDTVAQKTASVGAITVSALASGGNALAQTLNAAVGDVFFSIFPRPDAQNAGTAFAVEKALYGSSLSEADYEALLQGKDLPEEEPPSQSESQQVQTVQPQKVSAPTVPPPPPPVPPTPSTTPSVPPPSQPFSNTISISPGFGGGGPVIVAEAPPQDNSITEQSSSTEEISDAQNQATSDDTASSTAQTSDDQTQATSTDEAASSTEPTDEGTQATSTSGTDDTQPIPMSSCGQPVLATTGDFFSEKDDADYSTSGFLEYHFENLQDRSFILTWTYYDDQCATTGPFNLHSLSLNLPVGVRDWSVRFTSMTHFDVWDDTDNVIIGSYDVPVQSPTYTSIAFEGSAYDYADDYSVFVSRGLSVAEPASP